MIRSRQQIQHARYMHTSSIAAGNRTYANQENKKGHSASCTAAKQDNPASTETLRAFPSIQ